jgi:hypothetical protein
MALIGFTSLLILVGLVAYGYGAFKLSRYAFRISSGLGIGVMLFPPLALFFGIFQLEEEGKELPTAMCMFGLVNTIVLVTLFWVPLSLAATGQYEARLAEIEAATPNFTTTQVVPSAPSTQAPAPTEAPAAPEAPVVESGEGTEGEAAPAEEPAPAQ